jgi:hypothetical protein
MPKYYGNKPTAVTMKEVEAFENSVVIRHCNQRLLGKVYVDLEKAEWILAVAYNVSRDRSIRSRENPIEVRYTYTPTSDGHITVICSDPYTESRVEAGPFEDPDTFVRFALDHELKATNNADLR